MENLNMDEFERAGNAIISPGFARDPYPFYAALRRNDPVHWSDKWNCWILTRYDDVRECLSDFKNFSNRGRITGLFDTYFSAEELTQLTPLIAHYSGGLINVDPPDHTRMRKILHSVFRPSTIKKLEDRIVSYVSELLDEKQAGDCLRVVEELAFPLPVKVIAEVFGVPPEDTGLFTKWSTGIVEFMQQAQPSLGVCLRSQTKLLEMREYIKVAVADRRVNPKDDVLTLMVEAEEDGNRLTEEEILSTSVTILIGGHETTTRLMATTILELERHPEQRAQLVENPDGMMVAVEEFLRFCGPFHRDQRVCKEDVVLRGKRIKKGQTVLLMLAAANRDPEAFEDAENFELSRKLNKHLAFGYGAHICLGSHLARLEMAIVIRTLLERAPQYRLAEKDVEWDYGFLRGPKEVVITFDP
ncbi:MAG: cytochrome P450 [Opitutaceae bacterium]|nr:cytochrome P450 [Opitutaceae bacterium]